METGIANSPKQVHMSSKCHMTDKRHTFIVEKRSNLIQSLVEALERFEVGVKLVVFRLQQTIFFFGKT